MSFVVEVRHRIRVVQGLPSPVRERRGLPPMAPGAGVDLAVTAGVAFADDQLTERGWFFDTDAAAEQLERHCAHLEARAWTDLFDFRPTFELVARHLFRHLAPSIPQLAFVELHDETFGTRTRYLPPADPGTTSSKTPATRGGRQPASRLSVPSDTGSGTDRNGVSGGTTSERT